MSQNSLDNLPLVNSFETALLNQEPEQDHDNDVSDLHSDDENVLQTSPKKAPRTEERRDSASKEEDESLEDFIEISEGGDNDDDENKSLTSQNKESLIAETHRLSVDSSILFKNPRDRNDDNDNSQTSTTNIKTERRRRSTLGSRKLFDNLDMDGDGVIDVFELHTALIATNTLVPLHVVIKLFASADKDSDGTLSLEEFTEYLSKYEVLVQGSPATRRIAVLKDLLSDIEFWVVILYVVAGILLMIPSYFINIPAYHKANCYLAAVFMYLFNSSRFIFRYPFLKWAKQKSLEDKVSTFRKTLLDVAKKWIIENKETEENENNNLAIMDERQKNNTSSMDEENKILKVYVYEHLFQSHETSANFLKTDLEVMLLADMGNVVSGPLIEYIWNAIDDDNDGTIDHEEFYQFLVTNAEPPSKARQVGSILCGMIADKTWLFKLNYFASSATSFLSNVLGRYDITFSFGRMSTGVFAAWNFTIGTLYFSSASFDAIRDSYNMQQTAKQMIARWVDTVDKSEEEATFMGSKMLIHKFQKNSGLTRSELSRLLSNGAVYLPQIEFNKIFDEIDDNNDGVVERDEIVEYANRPVGNKRMAIFLRCLTNFYFWAQSTWFIGSINHLVAAYGVWGTWNYRFGATLFFVGAATLMYHVYQAALTDQGYAFSIYLALKCGCDNDIKFDTWKYSFHSSINSLLRYSMLPNKNGPSTPIVVAGDDGTPSTRPNVTLPWHMFVRRMERARPGAGRRFTILPRTSIPMRRRLTKMLSRRVTMTKKEKTPMESVNLQTET